MVQDLLRLAFLMFLVAGTMFSVTPIRLSRADKSSVSETLHPRFTMKITSLYIALLKYHSVCSVLTKIHKIWSLHQFKKQNPIHNSPFYEHIWHLGFQIKAKHKYYVAGIALWIQILTRNLKLQPWGWNYPQMAFVIPGHRCHKSGREKRPQFVLSLPMVFFIH